MTDTAGKLDWEAVRRRLIEVQHVLGASQQPDPAALEALFRRRTALLKARLSVSQAPSTGFPVLVFALGEETYAARLQELGEVRAGLSRTPVPEAPEELLGLVNLRGEICPVLDLARLLGVEGVSRENDVILFLRHAEPRLGLAVERVLGVETVHPEEMAPLPDGRPTGRFLQGITPASRLLLDCQALLSHPVFKETVRR